MVRRVRIKDHYGEQRIFTIRSIVAAIFVTCLLLTVASRLFYLQVLKHDYYAELSQGNRVRTDPIPPSRGLIFDRHGVVLAENLPAFQLELVREQVGGTPQIDATLAHLVAIGLLEAEDTNSIKRTILSHHVYESVPIKLQLNDEEMARFAVHRYEFTGVDIRTRLSRHYPFGPMAVHALGYVAAISEQDVKHIDSVAYAGTTLIGKLGVEGAYENVLHGTPGYREVLVNAAGRPVERQGAYTPKLNIRQPIAGADLILSIDMRVQSAAEEALTGKRGAAIAIDPHSGDVIALASTPGFDPNAFARGLTTKQYDVLQNDIDKPLINRALRGAYPPGSTVKPFYALAALKYGVMTSEQTLFCPGHFSLPGSRNVFRDWKPKGHGVLAMRHAIMQSCDVYFYTVASKLGIDRMHDFMSIFGFGEITGIDIPGEKPGLMPSTDWKTPRLQAGRRAGVVPGRDHQRRHRPGLHAGDAHAARARRVRHRIARTDLQAAAGIGRACRRRGDAHAAPGGARTDADRGRPRSMAGHRGRDGAGDRARRHGRGGNRGVAVQDRRQDRFGAGLHDRPKRKISREGFGRTAARSCAVHILRPRGRSEARGRGVRRERQARRQHRGADCAQDVRRLPAAGQGGRCRTRRRCWGNRL